MSGDLVGRSSAGRDNAAAVNDDGALKVDIGNATLSVTADGVEIKNDSGNPVPTEPLGVPAVARQLSAGSSSANTALTSTCRRISVRAVGADIRYAIGSSSQTASATSHFIANGERLDLAVPATPNIAVIRNASTDGTLELTELI